VVHTSRTPGETTVLAFRTTAAAGSGLVNSTDVGHAGISAVCRIPMVGCYRSADNSVSPTDAIHPNYFFLLRLPSGSGRSPPRLGLDSRRPPHLKKSRGHSRCGASLRAAIAFVEGSVGQPDGPCRPPPDLSAARFSSPGDGFPCCPGFKIARSFVRRAAIVVPTPHTQPAPAPAARRLGRRKK
jgi:hypothetical protein